MEGESSGEHLESAREHLEKAKMHATEAGAEAKAAASAKVDELRSAADEKIRGASARPKQWQTDLEDRVRRNPLQAILWAFAAGILIAALLRKWALLVSCFASTTDGTNIWTHFRQKSRCATTRLFGWAWQRRGLGAFAGSSKTTQSVIILLFAMIFRYLADAKIAWRDEDRVFRHEPREAW